MDAGMISILADSYFKKCVTRQMLDSYFKPMFDVFIVPEYDGIAVCITFILMNL